MREPKETEFKRLPRRSRCAKCLFNRRGLLFVGLFTILVGMTAVVSSKIVWPVILRGISQELVQKVHAIPIEPEILQPVNFENATMWLGKRTEISLPKNYNISDRPALPGEQGWWIYFYWATVNRTDELLPKEKNVTGIHWVLRNITGDITLYVRYSVLPTHETADTGLFVGLAPIVAKDFDPTEEPPVVYGCNDGRTVFFGIYSEDGNPKNFTISFDVRHDGQPDHDGNIREGCIQENHAERIVRALYPVMASFFLFCGCNCMVYWGYRKINTPETELYQIVGDRPVELINV